MTRGKVWQFVLVLMFVVVSSLLYHDHSVEARAASRTTGAVAAQGHEGHVAGIDPMQQCFGEADCDGWSFTFTHPLAAQATVRVFSQIDGSWVLVGSGVAGPTDDPVVLEGAYTRELPDAETPVAFVVTYRGRQYRYQALKPACGDDGCTLTQGYWRNHPQEWPVDSLELGGVVYSQAELLAILGTPTRQDATYILTHQLIAVKLNVAHGADDSAVVDTVQAADAWLVEHPLGSNPGQAEGRQQGIDLASTLDDYNNGLTGPGSCDD